MPVEIFNKNQQASGSFNNGEILENKPIGFPQDGGQLKPYSNLFYWAHAWTQNKKSTIGLHPHQGFEICSFVLKGNINHFDTKQNKWIPLKEGDVQIIRAGNGISHAEEIDDNSEIFQIWFDPNLSKTLRISPSYDDYKSNQFETYSTGKKIKKIIKGSGSPMKMDTENILINEYKFDIGIHEIKINPVSIHSLFIISGSIIYNESAIEKGTFIKVDDISEINFQVLESTTIFEIISPKEPSYETYSNMRY